MPLINESPLGLYTIMVEYQVYSIYIELYYEIRALRAAFSAVANVNSYA